MSKSEAEQILKQLAEYQKKVLSSKKESRLALQRAGLITKSGKLTAPYRTTSCKKSVKRSSKSAH